MINRAMLPALALVTALIAAGCGSSTSHPAAARTPAPQHTVSAATRAIQRAVAAECAPAQALDTSVNSATTIGQFASSVGGWEARLTAISHTPMTGVPESRNTARLIAVDYAAANFALSLAAIHDDPFGRHFSAGAVKRGYNLAVRKLQDVLNSCAAAGQG